MHRFAEGGSASAAHHTVAEAIRKIAQDVTALTDEQLHRLLSHFVLIRLDFLRYFLFTTQEKVIRSVGRAKALALYSHEKQEHRG